METKSNTFEVLNNINVSDKVKSKVGLSYLSWPYAWAELKKAYPDAFWTVYHRKITTTETKIIKDQDGTETTIVTSYENEVPYFTDGKSCYVKVGVTIEGREEIEELPVMDNRNNAVPLAIITMTAVNKAIQRAFVKACARAGLGLYIYAGEDLPEIDRKVIDYNAIGNNCDRYATKALSEEGFNQIKEDITKIWHSEQTTWPEDAQKFSQNYVQKTFNGQRIGALAYNETNCIAVQRVYYMINEVKKQLAAPSGR